MGDYDHTVVGRGAVYRGERISDPAEAMEEEAAEITTKHGDAVFFS